MHNGKPNIAFVTGGYSSEAQISYQSARTIENNLDREKYAAYTIDLTPSGWFAHIEGRKVPMDKNDFSVSDGSSQIKFDAALIGIHGTPGEDGKLQGYFDLLNIPYTTCDAATSALTFNKRYTVAVAAFAGIRVARSIHAFRNGKFDEDKVLKELKLPVFVKPNNGGSSIGMSKVLEKEQLSPALTKAFKEDDQVLIEEFVSGREFTVGVFRSKLGISVLPITEVISKNDFFDFEAKYQGKSEEITPANVDQSTKTKIQNAARKVFDIFNCRGVVRIDFIYNQLEQEPYLLEINTVPGQSEASIVPQQVRAMGWSLKDFYSALIDEALSRRRS